MESLLVSECEANDSCCSIPSAPDVPSSYSPRSVEKFFRERAPLYGYCSAVRWDLPFLLVFARAYSRGLLVDEAAAACLLAACKRPCEGAGVDVAYDWDLLDGAIAAGTDLKKTGANAAQVPKLLGASAARAAVHAFRADVKLAEFAPSHGPDGISVYSGFHDVPNYYLDTTRSRFAFAADPKAHAAQPANLPTSAHSDEKHSNACKLNSMASIGAHLCDPGPRLREHQRRFDVVKKRTSCHRDMMTSTDELQGIPVTGRTVFAIVDAARHCSASQVLLGVLGVDLNREFSLQGQFTDVRLVLSKSCKIDLGLYLEGHAVLVEGAFKDGGLFQVASLMHPPWSRDAELQATDLELFGGGHSLQEQETLQTFWKSYAKLQPVANPVALRNETPCVDPSLWIIIVAPSLDDGSALKMLAATFSAVITDSKLPVGFVFLGNLAATAPASAGERVIGGAPGKKKWKDFYKMIFDHFQPMLTSCKFVFVPAENDAAVLPQAVPTHPPPAACQEAFVSRVRRDLGDHSAEAVVFATNPARIRHFSKRLVFFTKNIFSHLSKDAVLRCNEAQPANENSQEHLHKWLCRTLEGQGHLFPVRLDHRIISGKDASLSLFPLPDLVFLHDTSISSFLYQGPNQQRDPIIFNASMGITQSKQIYYYHSNNHTLLTRDIQTEQNP
eukprot:GHVT01037824.1.p1 GENE.GHVT01037824.1~~GHVT01037824.1.p1  ORF type:complete len:712 (-),score=193.56 GHVT01037824.1:419-2434(-)